MAANAPQNRTSTSAVCALCADSSTPPSATCRRPTRWKPTKRPSRFPKTPLNRGRRRDGQAPKIRTNRERKKYIATKPTRPAPTPARLRLQPHAPNHQVNHPKPRSGAANPPAPVPNRGARRLPAPNPTPPTNRHVNTKTGYTNQKTNPLFFRKTPLNCGWAGAGAGGPPKNSKKF